MSGYRQPAIPAPVKEKGLEAPWRGGWYSHSAGYGPSVNPYPDDPWKTAWLEGFNARAALDATEGQE